MKGFPWAEMRNRPIFEEPLCLLTLWMRSAPIHNQYRSPQSPLKRAKRLKASGHESSNATGHWLGRYAEMSPQTTNLV